jgi:hypothetical protein
MKPVLPASASVGEGLSALARGEIPGGCGAAARPRWQSRGRSISGRGPDRRLQRGGILGLLAHVTGGYLVLLRQLVGTSIAPGPFSPPSERPPETLAELRGRAQGLSRPSAAPHRGCLITGVNDQRTATSRGLSRSRDGGAASGSSRLVALSSPRLPSSRSIRDSSPNVAAASSPRAQFFQRNPS